MEGLGARPFRKAIAAVGGFDEACTEFIRLPPNPHLPSLAKGYDPKELGEIPLAAQLMGLDPETMGAMAKILEEKGAPRIELNCGCPSNTVTGKGAGSSLLRSPDHLYAIGKAMVDSVNIPVSIKLRSGFEDTSLFDENILAAEATGAAFLTLHPRTKVEGYKPPANWDLIKRAKELIKIPLVGNGDIKTPADAKRMLEMTGCDALMIGRGAVINPALFWEIRAAFSGGKVDSLTHIKTFLKTFLVQIPEEIKLRNKLNWLKQLASYLFQKNAALESVRRDILRGKYETADECYEKMVKELSARWT